MTVKVSVVLNKAPEPVTKCLGRGVFICGTHVFYPHIALPETAFCVASVENEDI